MPTALRAHAQCPQSGPRHPAGGTGKLRMWRVALVDSRCATGGLFASVYPPFRPARASKPPVALFDPLYALWASVVNCLSCLPRRSPRARRWISAVGALRTPVGAIVTADNLAATPEEVAPKADNTAVTAVSALVTAENIVVTAKNIAVTAHNMVLTAENIVVTARTGRLPGGLGGAGVGS